MKKYFLSGMLLCGLLAQETMCASSENKKTRSFVSSLPKAVIGATESLGLFYTLSTLLPEAYCLAQGKGIKRAAVLRFVAKTGISYALLKHLRFLASESDVACLSLLASLGLAGTDFFGKTDINSLLFR